MTKKYIKKKTKNNNNQVVNIFTKMNETAINKPQDISKIKEFSIFTANEINEDRLRLLNIFLTKLNGFTIKSTENKHQIIQFINEEWNILFNSKKYEQLFVCKNDSQKSFSIDSEILKIKIYNSITQFLNLINNDKQYEWKNSLVQIIKKENQYYSQKYEIAFDKKEEQMTQLITTLSKWILEYGKDYAMNTPSKNKNKSDFDVHYKLFDISTKEFNDLSVYPELKDLSLCQNVYLNPIGCSKIFVNQEEYLETHFRLIKEDFIKGLRTGVNYYKKNYNNKHFKSMDISVFESVKIVE